MATFHESGNAKNVANFQDLISFTTGYGPTYNPANPAITLAGLNTKHGAAVTRLADVNTALAAWTTAVNSREAIFDPFSAFVTRIINAVQASAVPPEVIADVRTIARKLTGSRAKPKAPDVPDDPATPEDESFSSNSASQMSFDSRIENFDKLIQLLAAQAGYTPNEADLKITGLTALHTSMVAVNLAVVKAYTDLSNARIARDKELYDPATGLVDVALAVKNYVKSLFGASSPEFLQVSGIPFSRSR
ncbi:MAG: hypothetical protein IPP83_09880 [Flavobacteriales bacterium]|nr:hypothetical protein [Flavobacteriales bacterium]